MEVVILGGLVGLGYLFNDNNENNNPVNTTIKDDPSVPNGDNIYNSEHYNRVDQEIRQLAKDNFEESQQKNPKIINTQKKDRIGSDLYNPPLSDDDNELEELKEDFNNFTYSNASGSYIANNNFMKNDQGIGLAPYFKGNAPTNEGIENSRTLNSHQGGNDAEFYRSRRETTNFFPLEQQQVFGNTFGEGMGDPARYDTGILKTNQLPFTQERIQSIDVKDPINRDIDKLIAESSSVDRLRTETNPKLTYKSKVLSGKNMFDQLDV